jgi:hypothetical protein
VGQHKRNENRRQWRRLARFFLISFVLIPAGLIFLIMNYAHFQRVIDRFTLVLVDTAEINRDYNLLLKCRKPGKSLILDLGMPESEKIEAALRKLQAAMGLQNENISLAFHDKETPPGSIEKEGGSFGQQDTYTIFLSKRLRDRREQVNVLIHELCHIYVWQLDKKLFMAEDQEKLVDLSGIFLGFGVLTLNGLTDEYRISPDGGYRIEQKFFGYLKPEQFGYLLARFCAEQGIADTEAFSGLSAAAKKYYRIGKARYNRQNGKSGIPGPVLRAQAVIGGYWRYLRGKLSGVGIEIPELPGSQIEIRDGRLQRI